MNIYDFKAEKNDGEILDFGELKGKVLLIVNTVTLLETVRELKSLGIDVFFEEQSIHMISAEGELMLSMFFLHDSFCRKRHRGEKGLSKVLHIKVKKAVCTLCP